MAGGLYHGLSYQTSIATIGRSDRISFGTIPIVHETSS